MDRKQLREYEVTYEVRSPTAIGKFEHDVVVVKADTAELAVATVGESLRNSGLDTRSPVRVRRRSRWAWDKVPYVKWQDASDDNPAGLREDLLDVKNGGA